MGAPPGFAGPAGLSGGTPGLPVRVRALLGPLLAPIDLGPGHGSLFNAAAAAELVELDWLGDPVPGSGPGPVRLDLGVAANGQSRGLSGLHEFDSDQLTAASRGVRERLSQRLSNLRFDVAGASILGSWQQHWDDTFDFVPNRSIAGHTGNGLAMLVELQDLLTTNPDRPDPTLQAYLPYLLAETFGITVRILTHDPHQPDHDPDHDYEHEQVIDPITGPARYQLTLIHTPNPDHYHPTGHHPTGHTENPANDPAPDNPSVLPPTDNWPTDNWPTDN
jgi:hypothetical protein